MFQLKAEMHQPLEKKGPAQKEVNTQMTQTKELEFSSVSQSGKYHSLIQDQAQELTCLRQKMRIGRAISSLLVQHIKNTVNTFEELLSSSSNIDHCTEQQLYEQLAKGRHLAESLARKFSTDTSPAISADSATLPSNHSATRSAQSFCSPGGSPLHHTTSPSRTLEPGVSGPWNERRPQKMNTSGALCTFSSVYQPNSKPSGTDLLEKNLVDIQNLRQRLEKSVGINDRLQERLERVLSSSNQGKGTAQSNPDFLVTPH